MKALFASVMLLAGLSALAETELQIIRRANDGADGYVLYGGTNALDTSTNARVRMDLGTNCTVRMERLQAGRWVFAVAAYAYTTNKLDGTNYVVRVESSPSGPTYLTVPAGPEGVGIVAVQWIADLRGTNWTDLGFLRLRAGE